MEKGRNSFQELVKEELLSTGIKPSVQRSFLSGVLRGGGELTMSRGGFLLAFSVENALLAEICKDIIDGRYGFSVKIEKTEKRIGRRSLNQYRFNLGEEGSRVILKECGIMADGYTIVEGLPDMLLKKPADKVAFLKGVFLSCGKLTVPDKNADKPSKSGYHLEFTLSTGLISGQLCALIEELCELPYGTVRIRKDMKCVYIKSAEAISDCLAVMKANRGVMALQEIIASRSVTNVTNRKMNFDIANINKTVNAANEQVVKILFLMERGILDTLDERLKELAVLRINNPEASLLQLAEMTEPKSGKSAINHRMRRLISLSEKQREEEND